MTARPTVARCPTCHRRHKRSNPQNARYWLLLHEISEKLRPGGEQFSPESYHEWFKSKLLGRVEVKLPNGYTTQITNSTADLETPEFSDYMTKVEAWASERGVWLADLGEAS